MYFDDQTYEKQNFGAEPLPKGNYENCRFRLCNFTEADLKQINFTDCVFEECNLSMAKLISTQLNGIKFVNCKILGTRFEHSNPFLLSVAFSDCVLNMSSFYQMKLRKTVFKNCILKETDFTEADLQEAVFDNCDLSGAAFSYTQLQKADFRTAFNYALDPERNKLAKARFSKDGLQGLLGKYGIIID